MTTKQQVIEGQIAILRTLRSKFKEPDGSVASIGPLWDMAVAADVKAIHKTIDDMIASLESEALRPPDQN